MNRHSVLIAIKGLGLGGAEKLVAEGARFWDRETFDYHVAYALPWKDALVTALAEMDIPVTCIGGARGFLPPAWLKLRRLIEQTGASLVHAHLPSIGVVARLVSPVPVVYTEHNIAQSYRIPVRVSNRATYWRNRQTIAVSGAVAESLARYPGPAPRVIPNGIAVSVDPGDAAEARRELGINNHVPLVTHVGNIRPHKGHENLIGAVAHLRSRSPSTHVVSIGGEKRPGDLDRIQAAARAAGVDSTIRFLGSRSDALKFVAAADVVVNPSDVEGLPISVLEAMALSKPVVATDVGGVPTVIKNGETGLLVPPANPAALARAIDSLLNDRARAQRLGRSANEFAQLSNGLETMVRTVEDVYKVVLRARS